jgi:7-keto-8-aminopelargonate synthetase-like enzyme
MAEISRPHFDAAYEKGLMGVSCRVLDSRRVEIVSSGKEVIDYTRCGYLNLDAHPKVLAAAKASMDEIPSVHFSVARTRLSAEPLVRLEHCRRLSFPLPVGAWKVLDRQTLIF